MVAAIIRNQPAPLVKAYTLVRFSILRQRFLEEIGQYLPERGHVLDLGCGFGLFGLYYALMGPERRVIGVDRNQARIEMAKECAKALAVRNVEFVHDDALAWSDDRTFDAIYVLDLIHHFPRAEVEGALERLWGMLRPGGRLLLKDVSDRPVLKRMFTLALDRLLVGKEPIHYWSPKELTSLLRRIGFDVKLHTMNDILPYPHVLYVCTRELPTTESRPG